MINLFFQTRFAYNKNGYFKGKLVRITYILREITRVTHTKKEKRDMLQKFRNTPLSH